MSSNDLMQYYGVNDIIISDLNLFEFTLNEDGKTATVFLANTVNKTEITQLVIPYKCELNERSYFVTQIGDGAFSSCVNLISVTIPNSISIINRSAFLKCSSLKNIIIPNSVTFIGEKAFEDCRQIRWIRLSNILKSLEAQTFLRCYELSVIVIPSSVAQIKSECFSMCRKLKKIIIEGENLLLGTDVFPTTNVDFKLYCNPKGVFKNNKELQKYILLWGKYKELYYYFDEKMITVIYYDYNTIDKTLIIFDSIFKENNLIKNIDSDAFIGCFELEVLEINENILIKTNTFTDCENLTDVFINNKDTEAEKSAFPLKNINFTIFTSSNSNIARNIELQPYIYLLKENSTSHSSQLFIAGVGEVEMFNGREVVLTSKTLIDTGVSLSVNLEDIQANGGAKLYGKYASQAGMTVKLTDAMFRMEFLAANLGEEVELGGSAIFVENSIVENGTVKIDGEPIPLYLGSKDIVVWVGEQKSNSKFLSFYNENIQKGAGADFGKTLINKVPFANGTKVCVKYIKEHSEGQTLKVSANYLPDEMTAILTASLFAGDQNNLEMATKVGTLTITIPRLMLNGINEISMNMTGFSQMNIEGQALAVEESECDEGGYYATISKVLKNSSWTTDLVGIAIDNANHLKSGDFLDVYGVFYGIGTRPLTSDQYVVLPSKYVDNRGFITYDGKDDLLITVILKDDSSKITHGIVEGN